MSRIAVVTSFVELFDGFSLCRVVGDQLTMLLDGGHEVTFVAAEGCQVLGPFADSRLRQARIPHATVTDEELFAQRPPSARREIESIRTRLQPIVSESDVVITHDLVYLPQFLSYNLACRELAAAFPRVRWLHWIHSEPRPHRTLPPHDPRGARYRPFPNATLVYPNGTDAGRVAVQYGTDRSGVAVVPHPIDLPRGLGFHPLSRAIVERFDAVTPEVVAVYPVRLYRLKQVEKVIRLFAELKRAGASVLLLVLDALSGDQASIGYRNELVAEAQALGLTDREAAFSSTFAQLPGVSVEECARCQIELPHRVVMDLFQISNVYVHASASETYSLVCQEAAAAGNLLVLNDDLPAMREIYGDPALYAHFCSTQRHTTYQPSESAYLAQLARAILSHLATSPLLIQRGRIRRFRNPRAVYAEYLRPLLEAPAAVEPTARGAAPRRPLAKV